MAIAIGAKENSFANPIGLMSDCHRRIEKFLGVLRQLAALHGAEVEGRRLGAEEQAALEKALAYFREAAPRHTADEEEDLFPLLRLEGRPGLAAALAQLQQEHEEATAWLEEVQALGRRWLEEGELEAGLVRCFAEVVAKLTEHYRGHMALEEGEIFPLAQAELDREAKQRIGRSMAARRGVAYGGCP
jgi:hemerythrin-like domain-containing protein